MHALELMRMGANIRIEGRQAIVAGKTAAHRRAGDRVRSAGQRLPGAGGLVAKGETVIDRVYHIDRGYERIEAKLARVGASIRRVEVMTHISAQSRISQPGERREVPRQGDRTSTVQSHARIRRAAHPGRHARRQRVGGRSRCGCGPSEQRHHRARYRNEGPDKNTKLVLYCGGGFRSALVADELQKMGYTERDLARRRMEGMAGGGMPSRNKPALERPQQAGEARVGTVVLGSQKSSR